MIGEFISEDEANTFEGWLRYQGVDASMITSDELLRKGCARSYALSTSWSRLPKSPPHSNLLRESVFRV
jgi:hypothetical protein